jgi:hypothetical protein
VKILLEFRMPVNGERPGSGSERNFSVPQLTISVIRMLSDVRITNAAAQTSVVEIPRDWVTYQFVFDLARI